MNVTVENLAPCKKLVRIEIDVQQVDEAFASVTKDYQKQAALPGFRPGKAPRDMVIKKYEQDINDEVKRKLTSDSYRKALEEQKLDAIGYPDIEEIQFGRGQSLLYAATVETAPEFELPDYKGLPVKQETRTVTDEDMTRAFDTLRQQQVSYTTVDRNAQSTDLAVVNYTGTVAGKPITDLAPTAKGITTQQNFWIELNGKNFIPGFGEQLLGAKAGDKRTVNVEFPTDFVTPQLVGQKAVYEVEVVEVKEKVLPALDDAFAKSFGAESLEKLTEGVRRDLETELVNSRNRNLRQQLIRSLLDRVNFELPESVLAQETKNVVYDIVRENQKRGISRDLIEQDKDKIYSAAASGAKERVKVKFLLQKIAEKEDVKVSQEEIAERIGQMALAYHIPPDKFIKDLQKRNGIVEIYDQLMNEKVVDLLQANAQIEEVPATTPA